MTNYMLTKSTHAGKISKLYNRLSLVYDLFTDFEISHHEDAIRAGNIKKNKP